MRSSGRPCWCRLGCLLGDNWTAIRTTLEPFDLVIAIIAFVLIGLFIWWRIGFPGLGRLRGKPASGD